MAICGVGLGVKMKRKELCKMRLKSLFLGEFYTFYAASESLQNGQFNRDFPTKLPIFGKEIRGFNRGSTSSQTSHFRGKDTIKSAQIHEISENLWNDWWVECDQSNPIFPPICVNFTDEWDESWVD